MVGPPAGGLATASNRVSRTIDTYLEANGAGAPLTPEEEGEMFPAD